MSARLILSYRVQGIEAIAGFSLRAIFTLVWQRVTAIVEPAASVGGGDAVEGGRESGFGCARLGGPQGTLRLGPAGSSWTSRVRSARDRANSAAGRGALSRPRQGQS